MKVLRDQSSLTYAIWLVLIIEFFIALITMRWTVAFVSLSTLMLSFAPPFLASRLHIRLPRWIIAAVALFLFATLFLGEVLDFYERLWWWDIALHGLSALGFGFTGFLFVFILFEGDRYAAPAWAMGLLAFCFAVTIGVIWEVFEFSMDQAFGMNMQKTGLMDTMGDLIVDVIGAGIAGITGALYLRRLALGSVAALFDEFVQLNRRFFKNFRR